MRLEKLDRLPNDWDEVIRDFDTKTLFHQKAWMDHVLDIHPKGKFQVFVILDGQDVVGYFPTLKIWKGPVPIFGSPLGGTGTNFMGPLVAQDADQKGVLSAIDGLLGMRGALHLEISNPWMDREVMGHLGYRVQKGVTHLVELPATADEAWNGMKGTGRNRVRKAEAQGAAAEITDEPELVDHFFAQFQEVYGKQGKAVPFGIERPRSLWNRLKPAGNLLTVWVRVGDEIAATGLFPYDERCIYFWGAASWIKHHPACPNELLHWTVIKTAVERGIPLYNMCGGQSQFKDKFGGVDVPYPVYFRSALPGLSAARDYYRQLHFRSLVRRGPQNA